MESEESRRLRDDGKVLKIICVQVVIQKACKLGRKICIVELKNIESKFNIMTRSVKKQRNKNHMVKNRYNKLIIDGKNKKLRKDKEIKDGPSEREC